MRTYLLYYDFVHTSGNHAGMAYLVKYLEQKDQKVYALKHLSREGRFLKYLSILHSFSLACYLFVSLKKNDTVVFVEYLSKGIANQDTIAKVLRKLGCKNKFVGIVHLSGGHLLQLYRNKNAILSKLNQLDQVVVLGSSLGKFIKNIGYTRDIFQTFHYVDNYYYHPKGIKKNYASVMQVVCMGNLKRNFTQLSDIINRASPGIHFHICMGKSKQNLNITSDAKVTCHGFLTEETLLHLMQSCDVSLSVMEDTVGSNVITTGLATGLVQVVSDVGSIRDYCDEENSFFCNQIYDFVHSLHTLANDRQQLERMKKQAVLKAQQFSIEKFQEEFEKFIK